MCIAPCRDHTSEALRYVTRSHEFTRTSVFHRGTGTPVERETLINNQQWNRCEIGLKSVLVSSRKSNMSF